MSGLAALSAGLVLGCSGTDERDSGEAPAAGGAAPAAVQMIAYRDAGCGCCGQWAAIARSAGYAVEMSDHPDMAGLKRSHGVPERLASCHTTLVGGYVVEGHVPLEAVERLLAERPSIKGIAVPGMPLGSPGMEVPDGTREPFRILAFDAQGNVRPFAA